MIKPIFRYFKKFINFIVFYISFTIFLVFVIPFLFSFFKSKTIQKDSVLLVKIDQGPLPESESMALLSSFNPPVTMRKIRSVLEDAKDNPFIKGVLLELYSHNIGFAQAEEIRDLLEEFKKKGKFVYTFTDTFGAFPGFHGTSGYYLASVSDRIYMQPNGELNFAGIALEHYFVKDFLKKHSIKVDVFKEKEHKGAMDWALFQKFSEPVRHNLSKLLSDIIQDVTVEIADNRKKTIPEIQKLLNDCPLSDTQANEQGYVDFLTYKYTLYEGVKKVHANSIPKMDRPIVPLEKYPLKQKKAHNKVAVIYCTGAIKRYNKESSSLFSKALTERYVEEMVKRAIKKRCKGIILRVDSPGGDAMASEGIYGALQQAKNKNIKIIVSMGNVAASGGYWIATAADKIIAHRKTITGSIGVISAKFMTEEFWNQFGISWDLIGEGENADAYSSTKPLSTQQKEKAAEHTRMLYLRFIKKVADARGKTVDEVDSMAGGQVWSGYTAKELGLVDELGGLKKAKEMMEEILSTRDVKYIDLPEGGFYEFISEITQENELSSKIAHSFVEKLYNATLTFFKTKQQSAQLKSPYVA